MDDVDNDLDAHAVSFVDKVLELFGCALAGGDREEARNMIAETSIVCMLLNCHELYHVVASFFNPRQNFVGVSFVVAYTSTFVSHAYVGLVDPVTCFVLSRNRVRMLPLMLVNCWWVPEYTIKQTGISLQLPMRPT